MFGLTTTRKLREIERLNQNQAEALRNLSGICDAQLVALDRRSGFELFAVAKLIGFLQPMYAIPEDDPDRIAKSNELGEKVIKKLKDEFAVLNRGN